MPRKRAKTAGVGAKGEVLKRFVHPKSDRKRIWPVDDKLRLTDVEVVGKSEKRVSNKIQKVYDIKVPAHPDVAFHVVCCHFSVTVAAETPFADEVADEVPAVPAAGARGGEGGRGREDDDARGSGENFSHPNMQRGPNAEDIAALRARGIVVDNEDPDEENVAPPSAGPVEGTWGRPAICPRRASPSIINMKGGWKNHAWGMIKEKTFFNTFRMCFPEEYIVDVLLPETNKHLKRAMSLREFYVFLGCQFYMACFDGITDRRLWWSSEPVSKFSGAPFRLNEYISGQRFEDIVGALRYTNREAPTDFVDRFHPIRQLSKAWNKHYAEEYLPEWLNCLDESMNAFFDHLCLGFMVVPRKPHPFGNEYHTIGDGAYPSGGRPVIWRAKIQEGKDRPKKGGSWAFPSQYEAHLKSKSAVLMLEMTRPIHHTGRVVTMDSGFCVTAGILAMHDHGVFGQSLIKKRGRYWPKGVPGDAIDEHFRGKEIGTTETFTQKRVGKDFHIHCQKEDKYVTKMMSTHGLINDVADHRAFRFLGGEWKSFLYPEPISRHNRSKHWVDDHNNRRHDPIGLDETWRTKCWEHRQFTFFVGLSEVNANNTKARACGRPATPQIEFRKELARQMLENTCNDDGTTCHSPIRPGKRKGRANDGHDLVCRPKFTSHVWDFDQNEFKKVKSEYQKSPCSVCQKRVRTYCTCNKLLVLCSVCYGVHVAELAHTSSPSTN